VPLEALEKVCKSYAWAKAECKVWVRLRASEFKASERQMASESEALERPRVY
jgi:hypothetical protein